MPIVFIHGITVRLDGFNRLLGSVQEGLAKANCAMPVSGCYWGEYGRAPSYTGMSIPGFAAGVRAIGAVAGTPDTKALLMLLLEEPSAELADLKDPDDFDLDPAGFRPAPQEVQTRNAALSAAENGLSVRLISGLAGLGLPDGSWRKEDVRQQVHGILAAAAGADRKLNIADLGDPIERALTAAMYRVSTPDGDWPVEFPWNQAAAIAKDAFDQTLGGARGKLTRAVGNRAFTYALRHGLRGKIMPSLSFFLGDVMAWFRNRDLILTRLDEAVTRAGAADPLVLTGHSLGGVIAFEYCAQAGRDVALLATVGSQVGFFGELGALSPLPTQPDGKLAVPARLKAWRSYYDPDDALAFLAQPVFDRVTDIEIDTKAPFPVSHSEYWKLDGTYQKLAAAVNNP